MFGSCYPTNRGPLFNNQRSPAARPFMGINETLRLTRYGNGGGNSKLMKTLRLADISYVRRYQEMVETVWPYRHYYAMSVLGAFYVDYEARGKVLLHSLEKIGMRRYGRSPL